MKFGLFLATTYTPQDDLRAALGDLIDQTHIARDGGFASVWAGNHYLTSPLRFAQSGPLLSRLIPEAGDMMIGPNILVLPLLNPIQVAEDAVTMDWLTGGRYVLGVGLGYRDDEFKTFNAPKSERVARMTEAIAIIRQLFEQSRITYQGRFHSVDGLGLSLPPHRPGGPPIWIAASSEAAIRRAALLGDAWIITFYPSISLLREQVALYRDALAAANRPPPVDYPILKECYIGPNHKRALSECQGALRAKYDAYASWGQDQFLPQSERFDQPFETFARDRFLIGDASSVRDEIERYREELGVDHFIFRVQWPGLPAERARRTLELLSTRVLPHLRSSAIPGARV